MFDYMYKSLKHTVSQITTNIRGWRTNRKIVVFESDDWGSIRMSSKKNLDKLKRAGVKVEKCHYVQNDALASEEDLEKLFEMLSTFKSQKGSFPIITANVIMGNPDFKKIMESGFTKYSFEPFTTTLNRYPKHKKSFTLWKEGIKQGYFQPQFHGREHLQVHRWMDQLKDENSETRLAFDLGVCGLSTSVTSEKRKSYMAAFDWENLSSKEFILQSINEGLEMFKAIFGYSSLSMIAPNYTWHNEVEDEIYRKGVQIIQSSSVQKSPEIGKSSFKKVRHFTGQKNKNGQRYLVRNCKFEPSSDRSKDWVSKCMRNIEISFKWKKPAIVEMHRVNFIGFINESNRDQNLVLFEKLLYEIYKKWPDVEFMSSDALGRLILEDYE
jgi:hypothetical protein